MLFRERGGAEWIFVFLGNPGPRYAGTQAQRGLHGGGGLRKAARAENKPAKWRSLTCLAVIGGKKVLLMLPQTLMNLSGEAVGPAAKFYRIPPERVLVFSDEMALPPGSVRIRPSAAPEGTTA